ncbi:MAG: cob(I)yrinic acid a,c-diamide adenosyltransferase [Thermoleophilia bacterium]|nr:cob(I)yrinic acid a,c-diamide adenosyltransferase [Thermoleophilia bacterium]
MNDQRPPDHDLLAQVIWEQTRRQGLVHLYTGDGKGKTTAALGLALRALGRDRRVAMVQFLKRTKMKTGEIVFVEKMDGPFTIQRFGASRFATEEEKREVEESGQTVARGWEVSKELVKSGNHDLVILDEVTHVVKQELVPLQELIEVVRDKADSLELVLTGRHAPPELVEICDYVTEMKKIKHPFRNGIRAREGTEY